MLIDKVGLENEHAKLMVIHVDDEWWEMLKDGW